MPVIRDYPEWWVCSTFDEFKSQVNSNKVLKKFSNKNNRAFKEEAGILHVNQPHDQAIVQADNRASRQILEMTRPKVFGDIDPWKLIVILIAAN